LPVPRTYYEGSDTTGTVLAGPPTDVGIYTVVAAFAGSADYAPAQSAPVTFSVTPATGISGLGSVDEGDVYTLDLSAAFSSSDAISQWPVAWGDGQVQTVAGDPSSVTHQYAAAADYVISAWATDNFGTYSAQGRVAVQVNDVPPALTVAGDQSAVNCTRRNLRSSTCPRVRMR
jgi:hypothetical protein